MSNLVPVTYAPHPLKLDRKHITVEEGATLAQIIANTEPLALAADRWMFSIRIGGHEVNHQYFHLIKPKSGHIVEIRALAGGGGQGGKNPLRTVLTIAVVAAAAAVSGGALAPALGSSFSGGSVGAIFAGAGVSVLGSLAVNALIPPPQPKFTQNRAETSSQTLSITGARNNANPNGPIPKLFGRHRIYPLYAAQPYTETIGNDQYLNLLFCAGYGPLGLSDFRIGETLIWQYEGVEMEVLSGWPDEGETKLFRNSVSTASFGEKLAAGNSTIKETESDVDEIIIDFAFNGLVQFDAGGSRQDTSVDLKVEYRTAGTGVWQKVSGSKQETVTGNVAFVGAPAGEKYSDFRTQSPVTGGLQVTLTCPEYVTTGTTGNSDLDRLYLSGFQYRIYTKATYETNWTLMVDMSDYIAPGEQRTIGLPITHAGQLTDIRIESKQYLYQQRNPQAPLLPANGGGYERVPRPTAWQYTRALDNGNTITYTDKNEQVVRRSLRIRPPARGRYEVRITRQTPDSTDAQLRNELILQAIKTVQYTYPIRFQKQDQKLGLIALRIKATDQLNGVIDTFNCIAQAYLPVSSDGITWQYALTRNPAWAYADVLRGSANNRPKDDSQLDFTAIKAWADYCDQPAPITSLTVPETAIAEAGEPYMTFDAIIDYRTDVGQMLNDIANSSRAAVNQIGNTCSISLDQPKTIPVQHFTPHNTSNYNGEIIFTEIPHAFKARFLNEDINWGQDEIIVYRDGYAEANATKFESIEWFGKTRASEVWRNTRVKIAEAERRREIHTFDTDIEYIVNTKGDMIKFQHDVPLLGLASGRVEAVTLSGSDVVSIGIHPPVEMVTGASYGVRVRTNNGSFYAAVDTVEGLQETLTLTTPAPGLDADDVGQIFSFGEAGQETQDLILKEIQPLGGDLGARLVYVPAANEIHLADQFELPTHTPQVNIDPADLTPPPVRNLNASETVRYEGFDPVIDITLTWTPPINAGIKLYKVYKRNAEGVYTLCGQTESATYTIEGAFTKGESLDLKVVGVGFSDKSLPVAYASGVVYTVRTDADLLPPADVADFAIKPLGESALLSWSPVLNRDLSYYQIRHSPEIGVNATWNRSQVLIPRLGRDVVQAIVPARSGTYLIRAYDVFDVPSENASSIATDFSGFEGNVVATLTESPSFNGTKTGVAVVSGHLRLDSSDNVYDWPNVYDITDVYSGTAGLQTSGTYSFENSLDLGDVYDSRLTSEVIVTGLDINNNVYDWLNVYDISNVYGSEPEDWNVIIEVRTTNDDPAGSPTWSAWQTLGVSNYQARAFEFRARLESVSSNITPVIESLSVMIDMADRVISGSDVVADSAGESITFDPAFREVPGIAVSSQGLNTGDYYRITNKTVSGFDIQFFNMMNMGISRTFDFVAKGYGKTRS